MNLFELILTLLVGFFIGGTSLFAAAWLLDSHTEREVMRRATATADYMEAFNVDVMTAYETIKTKNFY